MLPFPCSKYNLIKFKVFPCEAQSMNFGLKPPHEKAIPLEIGQRWGALRKGIFFPLNLFILPVVLFHVSQPTTVELDCLSIKMKSIGNHWRRERRKKRRQRWNCLDNEKRRARECRNGCGLLKSFRI